MAIADEMESQGEWLFCWRSYLPLALIPLVLLALREYKWPFTNYFDYTLWAKFCLGVSLVGFAIRCITVAYAPAGTSGRNTKKQLANELNTSGMYSLVRHPLYLGNYLIGLGIGLAPFVWWLPVIYSLLFAVYYERIVFVEEQFLRREFGDRFSEWAVKTPAMFPRSLRWRRPPLPFSLRNVLRREYTALMVAILGNAGVQFTEHMIVDHRVVYEPFWVVLLVVGTLSYFVLMHLKKHTQALNVPGR